MIICSGRQCSGRHLEALVLTSAPPALVQRRLPRRFPSTSLLSSTSPHARVNLPTSPLGRCMYERFVYRVDGFPSFLLLVPNASQCPRCSFAWPGKLRAGFCARR